MSRATAGARSLVQRPWATGASQAGLQPHRAAPRALRPRKIFRFMRMPPGSRRPAA
jgi:hypothetical protein